MTTLKPPQLCAFCTGYVDFDVTNTVISKLYVISKPEDSPASIKVKLQTYRDRVEWSQFPRSAQWAARGKETYHNWPLAGVSGARIHRGRHIFILS